METVLRNIEESYRGNPRKMFLVYFNPSCAALVEELGFMVKTAGRISPWDWASPYRRPFAIYESKG